MQSSLCALSKLFANYHIKQNGIQTQAYRRLGCRPDWTNDPWLPAPYARSRKPCPLPRRPSPLEKKLHLRLKRLEIQYSPEIRGLTLSKIESFFVVAVAGQILKPLQQGFASQHAWNKPYRGCKLPLSARNSKFQWWKVYYVFEYLKMYGLPRERSTDIIQTLQHGSDLHARHGTTGFDVIADTQSQTHSTSVCRDTKLVDVVIFFLLVSNVL